jgi:ATP-binding cassette subfamily F protein 3
MFGGEASDKKVKVLSGGERSRLAMIKLLLEPVNFLILDEPTNHLDMRSKDVLKDAIRDFDGTAIVVSHDREFLDGLVTKVYEFGGGAVREHLGGIYDFLQKKNITSMNELQRSTPTSGDASMSSASGASPASKASSEVSSDPKNKRLSYEMQKEFNRKVSRLKKAIAESEKKIGETESAISILETRMATPEGAMDAKLYEQHARLKEQLDATMTQWEEQSMELESLQNENQ